MAILNITKDSITNKRYIQFKNREVPLKNVIVYSALSFGLLLLICHLIKQRMQLCWYQQYNDMINQYDNYQTGNTLYEKYALAPSDVSSIVDTVTTNLLAEPTLSSVFSVVGSSGHDMPNQLKAALDLQFMNLLGAPVQYPGRTITRNLKPAFAARSMCESHRNLVITKTQFDTFVTIVANSLIQSGVSQADVSSLYLKLNDMAASIVTAQ